MNNFPILSLLFFLISVISTSCSDYDITKKRSSNTVKYKEGYTLSDSKNEYKITSQFDCSSTDKREEISYVSHDNLNFQTLRNLADCGSDNFGEALVPGKVQHNYSLIQAGEQTIKLDKYFLYSFNADPNAYNVALPYKCEGEAFYQNKEIYSIGISLDLKAHYQALKKTILDNKCAGKGVEFYDYLELISPDGSQMGLPYEFIKNMANVVPFKVAQSRPAQAERILMWPGHTLRYFTDDVKMNEDKHVRMSCSSDSNNTPLTVKFRKKPVPPGARYIGQWNATWTSDQTIICDGKIHEIEWKVESLPDDYRDYVVMLSTSSEVTVESIEMSRGPVENEILSALWSSEQEMIGEFQQFVDLRNKAKDACEGNNLKCVGKKYYQLIKLVEEIDWTKPQKPLKQKFEDYLVSDIYGPDSLGPAEHFECLNPQNINSNSRCGTHLPSEGITTETVTVHTTGAQSVYFTSLETFTVIEESYEVDNSVNLSAQFVDVAGVRYIVNECIILASDVKTENGQLLPMDYTCQWNQDQLYTLLYPYEQIKDASVKIGSIVFDIFVDLAEAGLSMAVIGAIILTGGAAAAGLVSAGVIAESTAAAMVALATSAAPFVGAGMGLQGVVKSVHDFSKCDAVETVCKQKAIADITVNTKRKMFIDTIKAPIFLYNFCYKLI